MLKATDPPTLSHCLTSFRLWPIPSRRYSTVFTSLPRLPCRAIPPKHALRASHQPTTAPHCDRRGGRLRVRGHTRLEAGRKKGLQYFVQWAGYGPEDNSWIPATETHADDALVMSFHTANPSKPGYTRAFPQITPEPTPATNPNPFHPPATPAAPNRRSQRRQAPSPQSLQ